MDRSGDIRSQIIAVKKEYSLDMAVEVCVI